MISLALYIHWPFCKSKCPYCDFNSHVRESVAQEAWCKALLQELRWYRTHYFDAECQPERLRGAKRQGKRSDGGASPPKISSIFFGGGTPSLMPIATVAALIEEAEKIFGFTEEVEITLEANPTSVEAEKFRGFYAAGVNRVSLGIQSLTPRHLQFLGREHSAEEAQAAIALAADIFPRYSFDLIYALHDQSLAEWEAELQKALKLAGSHLSLYQLTIEPNTQFYHRYQSGNLPILGADESAEYYNVTQEIMEAAGMPAYEISNHAASGQASRHNLTYWQGGEYIGIGPGAHGRIFSWAEGLRHASANIRSPEKWLAQVQSLGHGNEEMLPLSKQEVLEEKLMMGIRLREGIPFAEYDFQAPLLELLEAEKLIHCTATHLIPTATGRLLLNSLIEKLLINE